MAKIRLVGVLNVTPDSFSDGGLFCAPEEALAQAKALIDAGAELVDVGGDSTRPGSTCVGPEEEWSRLEPILSALSEAKIPFAVDTHHSSTAQLAAENGAVMINDVSAGFDPEMLAVVAKSKLRYVSMYSRCVPPHTFQPEVEGDLVKAIHSFFKKKISEALDAGVSRDQLVLDPGMGKFISDLPERSWEVMRRLAEFSSLGFPLYLGVSRKGFLKLPHEQRLEERDYLSAVAGVLAAGGLDDGQELYVRTHNVALQRHLFSAT